MKKQYKVYVSCPAYCNILGEAFVSANNTKDANKFIKKYNKKHNNKKTELELVSKHNKLRHVSSDKRGVIYDGIYYFE